MHHVRGQRRGPLSLFMHPSFWFVAVLFVVLLLLWRGLGFAEQARDDGSPSSAPAVTSDNADERGEVIDEFISDTDSVLSIGGVRAVTMVAVEGSVDELLPKNSGKDGIERFWFVSDSEIYVEYQSLGSDFVDRMAFVKITEQGLARTSLYGQAGSGAWELIEGDEVLFTKPQRDLYERAPDGTWGKAN